MEGNILIEIPESAKFLPMKCRILGFGIQSTAQEIGIGNPGATDKEPGIHSWNLESRMQDSLGLPYMRRMKQKNLSSRILLFMIRK